MKSFIMKQKAIVIGLFILMMPALLNAQILNPVKWTFKTNTLSSSESELVFTAKIDKGWHLYSQFLEPGGPLPTEFIFEKSKNYKLNGKPVETKPKLTFDETFQMNVKYFDGKAEFKQKIKILSKTDFKVKCVFNYMVCNEGSCIPFNDNEAAFSVKGNPEADVALATVTKEDTSDTEVDTTVKTTVASKKDTTKAEVNILRGKSNSGQSNLLLVIFLISLGAGLAAIITPCVFPMVPMTVSFFMKGSKSQSQAMKHSLFFGASIILIFGVLGLILTLIFGKEAMYIISTHWIPNTIFFVIFLIFAFSFFGLFEITLPNWLINKSDEKADKGGYMGTFFVALTTVLVSFSCTGPIISSALFGLTSGSENSIVFLISMLGFALGFAIPFSLLAMFPSFLKKLKSGSWLNTVKIVFGFLEIALGLKFLSIADLGANWGILDREVYLALWIVVFALLGFYLLGKLKFKGDRELEVITVPRLMLSIVTFSFVVYMIPGLWGAPLKVLSGYVPPLTTQDFDFERIIVENGGTASHSPTSDLGSRKYTDKLHFPTGFEGFFDLKEAKAYAKKVNKPIFVDFTGKTCANCREMENNVWNKPEVKKILNEKFVMVALYADANFIDLPENEWIKSVDGKEIKTLGKKNINYQISRFNMNAQPYYVLMDSDETILTKENKAYDKDVQNFVNFLNEGIQEFEKKHKK